MRTENAADMRLDAMLENCIFYIFSVYEFSHSLDPEADIPFTSRRGYDGLASEQAGRCQKDSWLGRTS